MSGTKKTSHTSFFLILLLLASLACLAAVWFFKAEINGDLREDKVVTVTVPKGASTSAIADILYENGVIKNTYIFRLYSRLSGADGSYQYGDFTLNAGAGYAKTVSELQQQVEKIKTVTVTIPEGYNAFQIGEALEKAGLCTAEKFTETLNSESFDFDFLKDISKDENKIIYLDGFLFPDTYSFYADEDVKSIINRMFKNFEEKALTEEHIELLEKSGYTLEEWVILASIIQKESANVEEMYNVSSVFTNRLANASEYPKLESCTTNDYINNYIQPLYGGDTPIEILDAYDTYGKSGFPAGAIANPGYDALHAALLPNDTPYYFFVTDIEYTHYYGKTYSEHLANIEKAKAVNKTYGKIGL